jgi:aspartyl protease family protein
MNDLTSDDIAHLTYLVLLASAILGFYLIGNRQNIGKTLRSAALWGMIFVGTIAVVGLFPNLLRPPLSGQMITEGGEITLRRHFDSHFHMTLTINGAPTEFIVDTGATGIVLTQNDAQRAGFDLRKLNFSNTASTANGIVRTAPIRLQSVTVEGYTFENLPAFVNEGAQRDSLLGMSFLNRFSAIEIRGDTLTLTP